MDKNLIPILLSVCGGLLAILIAIAGYSSAKGIEILKDIREELRAGDVRMTRHESRLDNHEEDIKDHERRLRSLEKTR